MGDQRWNRWERGLQRGFSPFCPRSQRFHRWSPRAFFKSKKVEK